MSAAPPVDWPEAGWPAVPQRYRGVWVRTLLEAPGQRDDRSFVRWLQASVWHADLRVPPAARPSAASPPLVEASLERALRLAGQQGFCGVTEVRPQAGSEVCTWHRRSDFQPARDGADAGWMVFDTPDCLIETGVHAPYLEVWQRLPDSVGRCIVLAGLDSLGHDNQERVLVAGRYLMRVRPRRLAWPNNLQAGQSLAEVLARYPEIAGELLDFEISFGVLNAGRWTIEQSTLPGLEARSLPCSLQRESLQHARVIGEATGHRWQILEWSGTESSV
ncbi:MAG: hypothetical protein H7273_12420 [Polaromonas sp.]|nr:hypothetical protein [Polaromonas sp.]